MPRSTHKGLQEVFIILDIEATPQQAEPLPPDFLSVRSVQLSGLHNGTHEGRPALFMQMKLEDGRTALAELPMRLLGVTSDAFRAKYGKILD